MSYSNKSAHQLLVDRVNEVNGNVFSYEDLSFSDPIVTVENDRNTKFQVYPGPRFTPEDGAEYFVWVNRLDIGELFSRYGVTTLEVPRQEGTTTSIAQWIAATYGLPIVAGDVINESIEGTELTIEFSGSSKIFFGQLSCVITGDPVYLRDLLTVNILNGFDYPDAIVDHLVPPVVAENQTIASHATKENGTLLNGSGLPAGGMIIGTNNELELAIRGGYWKGRPQALVEPEDGVYHLAVTSEEEWNFIFSAAIFSEEGRLADMYDVRLYVESLDSGDRLEFYLTQDVNNNYHWINDEFSWDITDSAVSADNKVVQNAQCLSFYPQAFPNTARNGGTPDAFVGEFEIGLIGYRRNSLVPRVTATAKVVVTGV